MITLDKIKIVSPVRDIAIVDETKFKKILKNGMLSALKFTQRKPYLLNIEFDYIGGTVAIEFTGKILGKDYPKLISKDTINLCFEIVNSMGFCKIDIAKMWKNAEVVKVDITKDVKGVDVERLNLYIQSHLANYSMYVCRMLKKNRNLVVEKNVVSSDCKKRITIYNKEKEMKKAENKRFSATNGIEHSFDGICRFELNLNSKEQVRQALNIQDNKLSSVLDSQANPIYDFLKDVVIQTEPIPTTDWKSYTRMLVLKDCDYNLEAVEKKLRSLYPRGNNYGNLMKPYRALKEQIDKGDEQNYWQDILRKLS